jgi:hypothetical protein
MKHVFIYGGRMLSLHAGTAVEGEQREKLERCRGCGGRLTVIASIEDPALIERILAHVRQRGEQERLLALGARGPPPSLL